MVTVTSGLDLCDFEDLNTPQSSQVDFYPVNSDLMYSALLPNPVVAPVQAGRYEINVQFQTGSEGYVSTFSVPFFVTIPCSIDVNNVAWNSEIIPNPDPLYLHFREYASDYTAPPIGSIATLNPFLRVDGTEIDPVIISNDPGCPLDYSQITYKAHLTIESVPSWNNTPYFASN